MIRPCWRSPSVEAAKPKKLLLALSLAGQHIQSSYWMLTACSSNSHHVQCALMVCLARLKSLTHTQGACQVAATFGLHGWSPEGISVQLLQNDICWILGYSLLCSSERLCVPLHLSIQLQQLQQSLLVVGNEPQSLCTMQHTCISQMLSLVNDQLLPRSNPE